MCELLEIRTKRLLLRQWRDVDLPLFAKLNADPDVMQYYPSTLSTEQSNAMANKIMSLIAQKGWGLWAVEKIDSHEFIGFVGLHVPGYELPVSPCVEIGWRLAKEFWGQGYATEAARASLDVAFSKLEVNEIYSFTSVINDKSIAVMRRLQMVNTYNNFAHPMIPDGSALQEHVLYKINRKSWSAWLLA